MITHIAIASHKRKSFAWTLLACVSTIVSFIESHEFTDSFPTHDEYESYILDPNSIYGQPYGGWSRATRSRLAALPLPLPVPQYTDGSSSLEPLYTEVRDGDGRRYACRVHHESEVYRESLVDSMFRTARVKPANQEHDEANSGIQHANQELQPESGTEGEDLEVETREERLMREIKKLTGLCAQIHLGWWSYEWCHEALITQFHIHVRGGRTRSTMMELEGVKEIGVYDRRQVVLPESMAEQANEDEDATLNYESLAKGDTPLGKVVDTFVDGQVCDETGEPREASVEFICCSVETMSKFKTAVFRGGNPEKSRVAGMVDLAEVDTCRYRLSVCTPVMCEQGSNFFDEKGNEVDKDTAEFVPSTRRFKQKLDKGDQSIQQIISWNMENTCHQKNNNEWWAYEICYGKYVRQFHEINTIDAKSGATGKHVETEFFLGMYDPSLEAIPRDEENQYVVNVTRPIGSLSSRRGSQTGTIEGPYFKQEWQNGDRCDDPDVSDAAIKAGTIGSGGVERSTTVRYFCGPGLMLGKVNEDSTCHYEIDVIIPDLCDHPLFRQPKTETQVVKCLPIDEPKMQLV